MTLELDFFLFLKDGVKLYLLGAVHLSAPLSNNGVLEMK